MKKTHKIVNELSAQRQTRKFWNFIDNGTDSAELQLFGTISSEEDWWSDDCVTYRNFIDELNALGDKKNINVLIQSGGGDVYAANAIYTALVANKAKITGTVMGLCASAATIILMACDTRRIAKNAILMIHNPKITLWGQYESQDLLKMAEITDQVKESILLAYKERVGKTEDELKELMDNETWYVGQEAIDNGFADEIIESNFQNSITNENIYMINGTAYSFSNYLESFVPDEIRKKVQDLSKTPQSRPGTFFNTQNQTKKGNDNMGNKPTQPAQIENAAQLRTAYPDFVNEIVNEAIQAERDRMKAIDDIASGISDDILTKAKYEEPMSAADLALAQMKANVNAGSQAMNDVVKDLQNSGAAAVNAIPNAGASDPQSQNEEGAEKVRGFANALGKDKRRGNK